MAKKTWKWEKLKREEPAMRHRKQECDVILKENIRQVKRGKMSFTSFDIFLGLLRISYFSPHSGDNISRYTLYFSVQDTSAFLSCIILYTIDINTSRNINNFKQNKHLKINLSL